MTVPFHAAMVFSALAAWAGGISPTLTKPSPIRFTHSEESGFSTMSSVRSSASAASTVSPNSRFSFASSRVVLLVLRDPSRSP